MPAFTSLSLHASLGCRAVGVASLGLAVCAAQAILIILPR